MINIYKRQNIISIIFLFIFFWCLKMQNLKYEYQCICNEIKCIQEEINLIDTCRSNINNRIKEIRLKRNLIADLLSDKTRNRVQEDLSGLIYKSEELDGAMGRLSNDLIKLSKTKQELEKDIDYLKLKKALLNRDLGYIQDDKCRNVQLSQPIQIRANKPFKVEEGRIIILQPGFSNYNIEMICPSNSEPKQIEPNKLGCVRKREF